MKPIAARIATRMTSDTHSQPRPHHCPAKAIQTPVIITTSRPALATIPARCESLSSLRLATETGARRARDAPPVTPCAKRNTARPNRWRNRSQTYRFVTWRFLRPTRETAAGKVAGITDLLRLTHVSPRRETRFLRNTNRIVRCRAEHYRLATQPAIWARELKPSLFRMLRTWLSTVRSEMNRRAPICLLLRPSAISRATSASRRPSPPRALSLEAPEALAAWPDSPSASAIAASRFIRLPPPNSSSNLA